MTTPTTEHTIRLLKPEEITEYAEAGWTLCARNGCPNAHVYYVTRRNSYGQPVRERLCVDHGTGFARRHKAHRAARLRTLGARRHQRQDGVRGVPGLPALARPHRVGARPVRARLPVRRDVPHRGGAGMSVHRRHRRVRRSTSSAVHLVASVAFLTWLLAGWDSPPWLRVMAAVVVVVNVCCWAADLRAETKRETSQ